MQKWCSFLIAEFLKDLFIIIFVLFLDNLVLQ